MKKIKAAIIGYGNLGKGVYEAISASPDMEVVGVKIRDVRKAEEKGIPQNVRVVEHFSELEKIDVAFLCVPSRDVPSEADELLANGINTIDSYDIHGNLYDVQQKLDKTAKEGNSTAILGVGFDPGMDSVIRCLLEAAAPKGITYTNFGPGMSLGHTVAVKAIHGVKNALSVTIPLGTSIHRRMVYVELHDKNQADAVTKAIKNDPYFVNDETHVIVVDDVDALQDKGHGVNMVRKGVSGVTDNQLFEYNMRINNPALTSQVMVSAGRAAMRQAAGCYTMIEIPLIDLLPGEREGIIRRLV
ncbi:MAG: diaminopimelate dehydrogenase [Firmicutes bacterium]|nr:diaminopimelate dehydrogenase [Bacillota bacterium]